MKVWAFIVVGPAKLPYFHRLASFIPAQAIPVLIALCRMPSNYRMGWNADVLSIVVSVKPFWAG
jgi:hypothetical protein